MTTPRLEHGWLVVDCDAPPNATVAIALDQGDPVPAFLDYDDTGRRVAKIRPKAGLPSRTRVTLAINGQPAYAGKTP